MKANQPCLNCVTFNCKCTLPEPRRRRLPKVVLQLAESRDLRDHDDYDSSILGAESASPHPQNRSYSFENAPVNVDAALAALHGVLGVQSELLGLRMATPPHLANGPIHGHGGPAIGASAAQPLLSARSGMRPSISASSGALAPAFQENGFSAPENGPLMGLGTAQMGQNPHISNPDHLSQTGPNAQTGQTMGHNGPGIGQNGPNLPQNGPPYIMRGSMSPPGPYAASWNTGDAPTLFQHPHFGHNFEDPKNTSYVPYNPRANMQVRNLAPAIDSYGNFAPEGAASGIRPSTSRGHSMYTYFGTTACKTYFEVDPKSTSPDTAGSISDAAFRLNSAIEADEMSQELAILNIKQAFCLPSRHICRELVNAFFEFVYPQVPIVNKQVFLAHLDDSDPRRRPPLILIQAIMLAGAKLCQHPALMDPETAATPNTRASSGPGSGASTCSIVARLLHQRVKALYDASIKFEYAGAPTDPGHLAFNYPTVLVQVLCLFLWYWEGPEEFQGPFSWVKTAIHVAQTMGLHRHHLEGHLGTVLKQQFRNVAAVDAFMLDQQCFVWRKMWWWLFTRDRTVSVSWGRPMTINLDDCDVAFITMEDFQNYESGWLAEDPTQKLAAEYFIAFIQLQEISGIAYREQHSPGRSLDAARNVRVVKHLNLLMGVLFALLPSNLRFDVHDSGLLNLYLALLGASYFTTLYHINHVQLAADDKHWGISFQLAYTTLLIAQFLQQQKELNRKMFLPTVLVYLMLVAMIVLLFHTDLKNAAVSQTASRQLEACVAFLHACHMWFPGLTYLLVTFFTDRLHAEDCKHELTQRARRQLLRVFKQFLGEGRARTTNSFDINFLLNETKNPAPDDPGFALDDYDADVSLPLNTVRSLRLPPRGLVFYSRFAVTQLFPGPRGRASLPNGPQNGHNGLQNQNSQNGGPDHPAPVQVPGVQVQDVAMATPSDGAPTAAPLLQDPSMYFSGPEFGDGGAVKREDAVLDSQYFLNVSSGVDWSMYAR